VTNDHLPRPVEPSGAPNRPSEIDPGGSILGTVPLCFPDEIDMIDLPPVISWWRSAASDSCLHYECVQLVIFILNLEEVHLSIVDTLDHIISGMPAMCLHPGMYPASTPELPVHG
jgi:hypothetical protein